METYRILLTLRFDGSGFSGWQAQKNGRSVQTTVQDALAGALGLRPALTGCGRTDAGVHALGYRAHADIPAEFPAERLCPALNDFFRRNKYAVAAVSARKVHDKFHARYDIIEKEYVYLIQNAPYMDPFWEGKALWHKYPLQIEAMAEAASYLLGRRNFASFMASGSRVKPEEAVRTVFSASVSASGERFIKIGVSADGFLYNMVRIIAGTLIEVGAGRRLPGDMEGVIAARERARAGYTAPAHGLYLNRVEYK